MMAYYVDLYLTYFRFAFKSMAQYRADFAISFVTSIFHDGSTLVFLAVIFANIPRLAGWSFHEMLLIWGLAVTARNLANSFFDVPHRVYGYIRRGDMDRLLVRPLSPLLQIAGESGITLIGLGRALIGAVAILTALAALRDQVPWWAAFYLPLVIVSSVLLFFSVQLLLSCLGFWFVNTVSVLQTVTWMYQFGQYPVSIFALPLQFLFTWVLPYAMMGFYPTAFMLRGSEYRLYGLLAPLMGFIFFGASQLVWRVAIRRYQSTGS
jgi:ABC-2 type transport system permease protein